MDLEAQCIRCKQSHKMHHTFSCGHYLCSTCLLRILLFSYIIELSTKDIFDIQCTCNSGNKEIICSAIRDIISNYNDYSSTFCGIYCGDPTELTNNNLYLNDYYCHDCQENVYDTAAISTSKHSEHKYQPMKEYVSILRNKIFNPNYEEIPAYVKMIECKSLEFKNKVQSTTDMTVKKMDSIILQLEELKAVYIKKMNQTIEKVDIITNLIRFIYSTFFNIMKTTHDVSFLQDMIAIHSDITEFGLQDETESKINKFEENVQILIQSISTQFRPIQLTWKNKRTWANTCVLSGHKYAVHSIIQLKDGRIASGSTDNLIKIWQFIHTEYKNVLNLNGHNHSVLTLLQIKDGHIASGSKDKTIKFWEVTETDFRCIMTFTYHNSDVLTLIQLKDGRIASGSQGSTIKLFLLEEKTFKNIMTLTGHTAGVASLIQLQDGRIASVSYDLSMKIWVERENIMMNTMTLAGYSNLRQPAIIQLKNGLIVSIGANMSIKVCEIGQKDFKNILTVNDISAAALIQLKDGRIAMGSHDKSIQILEMRDIYIQSSLKLCGHVDGVYSLIQLKDGKIASGSKDKTIRVWEETENP